MTPESSTDPAETDTIAPPGPAPGTPLGSLYVLDSVIGGGATGRVWRGRRREDDAPVAVKVLRGDFTGDPDTVVRFLRQRTVLHALEHPHLVRVRDLVAEGDVLAIVMDLVEGEDLRRLLVRRALRADQRLTVLGQVAAALTAVHAAGVVHRDVKPENVLVTWQHARPFGLLTDFGTARVADGTQLTGISQLIGTPAYVAPELVAGRPAGPPADLYSLGVTLYEVLTGQRPFRGEHSAALLRAHLEHEPTRPPGLPDPLWELLRGCLAKEPADRPAAADVAADLLALAEAAQAPPEPIPPPPPPAAPPPATPAPAPAAPAPATPVPERAADDGDGATEQLTTGATRPAAPTPAPTPTRRRRTPGVRWMTAIAACVLAGAGAGLWFGRPAGPAPAQERSGPAPARYHAYYLPVTATSPRSGTIRLQFSDASGMTGFQYYVVFRDQDLIAHPSPDRAPPYVVYGVDPQTKHCWMVAALLETDRPPPSAPAKPACTAADGQPTEN
ncbi:MAG TPA: serine/threonine-protein kinase [Streptosporangiaceae bacterium]|nr:serine/threonine-protein kinase [Streptosporangiaceae bacterium]